MPHSKETIGGLWTDIKNKKVLISLLGALLINHGLGGVKNHLTKDLKLNQDIGFILPAIPLIIFALLDIVKAQTDLAEFDED